MEPQFRFCTSADGTRIAYATYGSGPPLLYAMTWVLSIDSQFQIPEARAYFDALASRLQLIMFDRRGGGASTRDVDDFSRGAEASDIAAVAAAAGLETFSLFSDVATSACATYGRLAPERVKNMVFWYPMSDMRGGQRMADQIRDNWSLWLRRWAGLLFPDGPVAIQRALAKAWRDTVSQEMSARRFEASVANLDDLFAPLNMPVLLLQREEWARRETIQTASALPRGELKFVPGHPATPYPQHESIIDAVFEFVGVAGADAAPNLPGGTSIILFTDIVDSTTLTERMGDAAFHERARALDAALRGIFSEAGGVAVDGKLVGDGVLATFPSAAQAIDAALRCGAAAAATELQLHVGLHAGDVIRERDNVFGGAVNIANRICGLSAPGEVLVSQTVRDLARTSSGVRFDDRGDHALKGIEDPVRVFAVRAAS
jgi:class 3 adenylate cyclase